MSSQPQKVRSRDGLVASPFGLEVAWGKSPKLDVNHLQGPSSQEVNIPYW